MLYIALILSLSTAIYFAIVAVKRGKDYNRLLERYKNSLDICTMWRRTALKLARDVAKSNRKITEREKCITKLTNQVNHLKQSTIKAGIILQSCGSVDCAGKPNNCKLISSLFGDIDDKIDKRCGKCERSVE